MSESTMGEEDLISWTIRTLVRGCCTPELESAYVELNGVLTTCNTTSHHDELDFLFGQVSDQNIDNMEVVPSVDTILRMATARSLNNCGVELNDDVPLTMLLEAADIILLFDPTDTPTILVDLVDAAEDPVEAVCMLLAQLGTYELDDWYPQVMAVSDHFTGTVRKYCKEEADRIEQENLVPQGAEDLLLRLSRLVKQRKDSLGAVLGAENIGLGVSTESLYAVNVARLIDASVEQATDDIFSLAVISNEAFDVAMESVSACFDDLFYDVDKRREAEQHRLRLIDIYKPLFGRQDE